MSFSKKKSTLSFEFNQDIDNNDDNDDFEDLSFNIENEDEIETQQQDKLSKELEIDSNTETFELLSKTAKTKNKEDYTDSIPPKRPSQLCHPPIITNTKNPNQNGNGNRNGNSMNTLPSSSASSSSSSSSTRFVRSISPNTKKSTSKTLLESISNTSSPSVYNFLKNDALNSSINSSSFNNVQLNNSSLSTKIDLLTQIMDKNEEKQQQQYNSDMNQINFELFDIKQKVGQSMKRLQQEMSPILKVLKEHDEKEKREDKLKCNGKDLLQTSSSLLNEKEKTELLLEQESLKAKNESLKQDLTNIKSQFINFYNENQILRKRLDIISKRLPILIFLHIITFAFIIYLFIHEMPLDKRENIYELSLQGRNYVQFQFRNILKFFYNLWYQIISSLNSQYYY
ncbi:hypothetical protein LY90DRAFT_673048 [Neocallimastix californiae]|uniref:Transmembrane protein n=1 Tax=Neocallimastix californiae TaxID=1754190 RepID=A0A1Y2BNU4_9FUNG|nr:hypothetical protein LY90DRAFT_673048 [Neocallimastix californiae]|eukprot:ORY36412.1 hypothetical protein LY90DRAFT_673048 [Neocallimastix californiae]